MYYVYVLDIQYNSILSSNVRSYFYLVYIYLENGKQVRRAVFAMHCCYPYNHIKLPVHLDLHWDGQFVGKFMAHLPQTQG